VNDNLMGTTLPELYSKVAVAPLYIIQLIFCIVYLIFSRKDKGIFVFIIKIYCIFIMVNYLVALYFRFIH
jgi:hypothetical protein